MSLFAPTLTAFHAYCSLDINAEKPFEGVQSDRALANAILGETRHDARRCAIVLKHALAYDELSHWKRRSTHRRVWR